MSMQAATPSLAQATLQSEEDAIYRKINWRIIPIILLAYILAFLDRINVGFTQLQMKADLGFSDGVFGLGAGLFFITYLIFEVPSNLLLEKIGARLSFLRIMVLWGLTSAAMFFVTETWHFYTLRLLLGVFEAGFFPGVILYLTYWYPSSRRARVTGLFLFGMPITGVIGGPISERVKPSALSGATLCSTNGAPKRETWGSTLSAKRFAVLKRSRCNGCPLPEIYRARVTNADQAAILATPPTNWRRLPAPWISGLRCPASLSTSDSEIENTVAADPARSLSRVHGKPIASAQCK